MDRRWVTEWEGASCYWVGSVWGLGGGFMGGGVSCTQCLLIAACLCVWTQLCVESETHSGLCFQTLWWECAAASPSINIQCKQWWVCRAPPPLLLLLCIPHKLSPLLCFTFNFKASSRMCCHFQSSCIQTLLNESVEHCNSTFKRDFEVLPVTARGAAAASCLPAQTRK